MLVESKSIENYFYDNLFLDSGFVVKEVKNLKVVDNHEILEPFSYGEGGLLNINIPPLYENISSIYLRKKNSQFLAFTNRLSEYCDGVSKEDKGFLGSLIKSFVSKLNTAIGYLSFDDISLIPDFFFEDYNNELSPIKFEVEASLANIDKLYQSLIQLMNDWKKVLIEEFEKCHGLKIPSNYNELDPEFSNLEFQRIYKNATTRMALLYELGILEFLVEKYPDTPNSKMGMILGHIVGMPNNDQIRKLYSETSKDKFHLHRKNNPFKTKLNQEEIDKLLEKFK